MKLKKPIKAHGEEIDALSFREPTTEDIIEIGLPTLIISGEGGAVGVEIRQNVIAKYISKLAAIPLSSVKSLSLADFSAASGEVMGFFNTGDTETQ